ncbi:hypothetical protein SAMN05216379_10529 [Nitrosomonas eutropha]|uniref:Uncharacterized protein n=1 Tax=Nitrosomonas eutropha TaxID=916 RepID=A0ABX5M8K7_9PROT|nr:hypothetical protein C8R14_10674 [Nitrosomonas eutropha]SCX08642.1 hypothetical protein SAMN05216379_10529 [Nitrosomonas eutropha]
MCAWRQCSNSALAVGNVRGCHRCHRRQVFSIWRIRVNRFLFRVVTGKHSPLVAHFKHVHHSPQSKRSTVCAWITFSHAQHLSIIRVSNDSCPLLAVIDPIYIYINHLNPTIAVFSQPTYQSSSMLYLASNDVPTRSTQNSSTSCKFDQIFISLHFKGSLTNRNSYAGRLKITSCKIFKDEYNFKNYSHY